MTHSEIFKESSCSFRQCQPEDADASVPLLLSSGPALYRYVFSIAHKEQAAEFAHFCFCKKRGQLSHTQHTAAIVDGVQVGVVGLSIHRKRFEYFWAGVFTIFSFYGFFSGLLVAYRGLRLESILRPSRNDVGLIYNFGVHEGVRGRGIGQGILEHMYLRSRKFGLKRVGLDVSQENPRARALYERQGFVGREENLSSLKSKYGSLGTHHYMERPAHLDLQRDD